ncbi:maleylpyruvate isomerase family mycothiol-dependent enzyme [Streptomyces sp. NPDC093589]|uniref:maleylpyruvate isomerase family mycothiol-dependent enzyme n=1 Tax=Streptomyces sp. NPDC093589 TaxID=3366043 RepID=UPI0037F6960C
MTPHSTPDPLHYDDHCAEISAQTALLTSALKRIDDTESGLTATVPSCPDWNLGQLLRHVGSTHRWVETIVRTRATQPPPDTELRNLPRHTDEDIPALTAWLTEGAEALAHTLRTAGPDARVWTPLPSEDAGTPRFFARRMAYETLIHRADAALATGAEFTVDQRVAMDALDEWMELGSLPEMFEYHPERRDLLGPGRTLHFHATDTPLEAAADWVVDLTGDTLAWRRSREETAVTTRGPLTELLLLIYGRRAAPTQPPEAPSPHNAPIEVLGDTRLLDSWLRHVNFE